MRTALIYWQLRRAILPIAGRHGAGGVERDRLEREQLASELDAARDEEQRLREQLETSRLQIEVRHEGDPLRAVDTRSDARRQAPSRREGPVCGTVSPSQVEGAAPAQVAHPVVSVSMDRELREQGAFLEEVETYLVGLRDHWVPALRAAAIGQAVTALRLVVRNPTDAAFAGVELQIHFPGDRCWVGEDPEWSEAIPLPPKPWGEQTLYSSFGTVRQVNKVPDPGRRSNGSRARWVVTYVPFDLRAKRRIVLAPISCSSQAATRPPTSHFGGRRLGSSISHRPVGDSLCRCPSDGNRLAF